MTASICSSTTSAANWSGFASSRFLGPTARKPVAISSRARSASAVAGKQVAGDLFDNEAIERHVGVHGVDDVVAVAPGIRERDVRFLAARFGKPRHVQPVPAPAFAELLWSRAGHRSRAPSPCRARLG